MRVAGKGLPVEAESMHCLYNEAQYSSAESPKEDCSLYATDPLLRTTLTKPSLVSGTRVFASCFRGVVAITFAGEGTLWRKWSLTSTGTDFSRKTSPAPPETVRYWSTNS